MTETSLRVLIVDQNLIRASILEDGLREAGYRDLIVVRDMQNLLRRIVDEEPDVILIDLENPESRRAGTDVPGVPGGAQTGGDVRRPVGSQRHRGCH